jgi:NAD(P)-dependent dehydrogenase (short-subunit alcohol dehydrogenase family)
MDLHDRVALVTGARRIGAAVARDLAARGAHVAVCYHRSRDQAEEVVADVRRLGRRAEAFAADLSRPAECRRLVGDVVGRLGRLDVLVNLASRYVPTDLESMSDEEWEAALAVDLRASFACAQAAVPHMRVQGGGRIINCSDWVAASGRPRYPGYLGYYVAKAGVKALAEALALELARDNILVNAVAPGPIVAPPDTSDEERAAIERVTPLGRWGGEDEIAKVVAALVDSDFVTGETIRVDGGRHVR